MAVWQIQPPLVKAMSPFTIESLPFDVSGSLPESAIWMMRDMAISSFSTVMSEIRGITEEKLEEIKAGYAESKAVRDLMTVLAPFKLTPKTAIKIYFHFGPDGAALLRKSFYQLCQIPGFGFKRVDAIVVKSGGNLKDPMRVRGALFYALEKSRSEDGHLYLEAEKLLGEALALLNEKIPQLDQHLQRFQLEQELRAMVMNNVVVSKREVFKFPY